MAFRCDVIAFLKWPESPRIVLAIAFLKWPESPRIVLAIVFFEMARITSDLQLATSPGDTINALVPIGVECFLMQVTERDTAFPCAPAATLPKTDAFACGAAVAVGHWVLPLRPAPWEPVGHPGRCVRAQSL